MGFGAAGAGENQQRQRPWAGHGESVPVTVEKGEVGLQGPAVVAPLLGLPVAFQGQPAGLLTELAPTVGLSRRRAQAIPATAAEGLQLGGRSRAIRRQLRRQPLHRQRLKPQPAAIQEQHRQTPVPVPLQLLQLQKPGQLLLQPGVSIRLAAGAVLTMARPLDLTSLGVIRAAWAGVGG